MRVHEPDYRRRFDRCRDEPYARRPSVPDGSPVDQLATSVGDAVSRLIRAFEAPTPTPTLPSWPGREREERAGHRRGCGCHDHYHHDDHHDHHHHECGCGHHDHHACGCGHHDHHDRHCGCEPGCCTPKCGPDPCHCSCCIGDVDLVVYARVGETRVVPIRIENLRKRERDIELQLSEFTTKGGNPTPVRGQIMPPTTFKLGPCSEREAIVVIKVGTPDAAPKPSDLGSLADRPKAKLVEQAREAGVAGVASMNKEQLVEALSVSRPTVGTPDDPKQRELRDVDDCHVAVADLRVQGCDTRPIRIAVAVLPRDCGPYDVRCDCGCC